MGLLANGNTCEVLQDGVVQGYVFTESTSTTGCDQLQRWFLYSTFVPVHDGNDMRMRLAQNSPWSGITTASAFIAQVESVFRDGDRYVMVNCSTAYTTSTEGWQDGIPYTMPYPLFPVLGAVNVPAPPPPSAQEVIAAALTGKPTGGTRVEIERATFHLPSGELEIERAVFRPAALHAMQMDPGTGMIWQGGQGKGYTYTTLQSGTSSQPLTTYERFLFVSGYTAVPGTGPVEAVVAGIRGFGDGSLNAWVDAMNQSYWVSGSSVVICSCSWGYTAQDIGMLERRRTSGRGAKRTAPKTRRRAR